MNIIIKESKKKQAIQACDKVINGIEDGTFSVLSALLQCKKIARLVDDYDGMEWLGYEYGGYPKTDSGNVEAGASLIATYHGRSYKEKDSKGVLQSYIFLDLCSEIETTIESCKKAITNYSTQGISVAGEYATPAAYNITSSINNNVTNLINNIKTAERRLSILKAQYYDYAVKWQIELSFGNAAKSVFEEYQGVVDNYFNNLSDATIRKLKAIEASMDTDDPERYAQVLTSCRRLWKDVSKQLFEEVLPGYQGKVFKTNMGKDVDVSGDHFNNRLSAVIETLQRKTTKNTLVGSETVYLVDWLERINSLQSTGVHSEVTRSEARQCIIHTYIALGDILNLKKEVDNSDQK